MHGLLVEINIEAGRDDDANEFLKGQVVPRVREAPGFVAAYWWRSSSGSGGSGRSLVVFETEEAAKAAAEMASTGQMPMPEFASMGSAEIVEIVAQA